MSKSNKHPNFNRKVVDINKLKGVEAPIPETISDAIVVLQSLVVSKEQKLRNSGVANPIAKTLIGKSMGIDGSLLDNVLNLQEQENKMEIAALKLAIDALEELNKE